MTEILDLNKFYWIEARDMQGSPILKVRLDGARGSIIIWALMQEQERQMKESQEVSK